MVLGSDAEPVEGAVVHVANVGDGAVVEETTDARGEFVFEALASGRHRVHATAGELRSRELVVRTGDPYSPNILTLLAPAHWLVRILGSGAVPISGARVVLDETTVLTTDPRGETTLTRLEPGAHTLAIRADGYANTQRSITVASDAHGQERVHVQLVRGGQLEGVVESPSGAPVAGAEVFLHGIGALPGAEAVVTSLATTDDVGHFTVTGATPGKHRVTARAAGFASGQVEADIHAEPQPAVHIRLSRAARIAGTVRDARARAVAGATVHCTQTGGGYAHTTSARIETNARGQFAVADLGPGDYLLTAVYEGAASAALAVGVSEGSHQQVTLTLGLSTRLAGWVRDSRGEPVSGVTVEATHMAGSETRTTLTGADGKFEVSHLLPDSYRLLARWGAEPSQAASGRSVVVAAGTEDIELRLDEPGAIVGRIDAGNSPLPESYDLLIDGRVALRLSSSDADFKLEPVHPGSHSLAVRATGIDPIVLDPVQVVSGDTTDVGVLKPTRGIAVTGCVTDDANRPVAGAEVMAAAAFAGDSSSLASSHSRDGLHFKVVHTSEDGRFRLEGLRHGLLLVAEHPELGRSTIQSVLPGAESQPLSLVLGRGAVIAGRVLINGAPTAGVLVALVHQGEQAQTTASFGATTDSAGRFAISKVPSGRFLMTAMTQEPGKAALMASQSIQVGPEERELTRDFELKRFEGPALVVRAPNGDDMFLATASVRGKAGVFVGQVRSGEPMRVDGLVPGEYSVCLQRQDKQEASSCRAVMMIAESDQILEL